MNLFETDAFFLINFNRRAKAAIVNPRAYRQHLTATLPHRRRLLGPITCACLTFYLFRNDLGIQRLS